MKRIQRAVDYTTVSHDELNGYGIQMLVRDAPELSVILRGHLLIERVIETLISARMKKLDHFFRKHRITFEMKVDLAAALDILPDTHVSAAKALNSIRNSYAHREDHNLTFEELNSLKIRWDAIQKKTFTTACTKDVDEAGRVTIIFLNWSFLQLLPQADESMYRCQLP